jgi:uncharacterized protein (DUF305 family)
VTIVALCLGVLLGWLAFGPRHPGDAGADAGFARDMSQHHAQAVQMSQLVMQRTDDEDVRRLATDIDNNQSFERGQMAAWLGEWGLTRAGDREPMAWMEGHDHASMDLPTGVVMPGMATPVEVQELTESSGRKAEILYLQLMTTHHIAGVDMARAALVSARDPDVLAAAQRMVDAQSTEIAMMDDMLRARGAEPREDVTAWLQNAATDDATSTEDHEGDTDH